MVQVQELFLQNLTKRERRAEKRVRERPGKDNIRKIDRDGLYNPTCNPKQ